MLPLAAACVFAQVGAEVVTDADGRIIKDTRTQKPTGTPPPTGAPAEAAPAKPGEPAPAPPAPTAREKAEALEEATRARIDEVREAVWAFTENLPNFTCEQHVKRNESEDRAKTWKLKDRVFVDVVYSNGVENYINAKHNGKPIKKGSPLDSGSWSTGEYGTIQKDVLAHNTDAKFRYEKDSTFGGRAVALFSYTVQRPNSHWKVTGDKETLMPAYRGQIWVDKENKRILRIEMQARQIPKEFQFDAVDMTVDYGTVKIGGKEYVMPVRAENLACQRYSLRCTKNETEFKNYKQFSAESTVSAAESTISFDAPEEKAAELDKKKPKKK